MSAISGVAVATISNVADPLAKGRVLISLPGQTARGVQEWAQVVSAIGASRQLEVNDEVLVAFENGDPARPFVIGMLWQGSAPPPEQKGTATVHLPTGGTLHPIAGGGGGDGSSVCATTADLERQVAPWLASTECLLRVLALLKPLIDIVQTLPAPRPASLAEFGKAAAALRPCLLMNTPASALPLVKDLLCLTLQSLKCVQSSSPADQARAAVGIQGVLDLGGVFFGIAGVTPIPAVRAEQSCGACGGYPCDTGGGGCTRRLCVAGAWKVLTQGLKPGSCGEVQRAKPEGLAYPEAVRALLECGVRSCA